MTPERMAALVVRWARLYTRDLPAAIAERRVEEIAADLHDHIAHERAHGTGDRRIVLHIVSRMVRGLAADVAWRVRHRKGELMRSFVILAAALAVAAIGIVAILYGQEDDAPGLVLIGILLIVGAFAGGVRTAQRSR